MHTYYTRLNLIRLFSLCSVLFTSGLVAAVTIDQEGLPETGLDTSAWVAGQLPPLEDMWSLNDFQMAAKNTITKKRYVGFRTGALDENTYQANLNIWKDVRLNSFTFRDVSRTNLNTSILGHQFTQPFFIAPAANAGNANATTAELALARAAGRAGILYVPSISATKSIEEIAGAGLPGQTMFHQEYIWSNNSRNIDELNRIKAAGFKAIFLTVDNTGINGIRTRSLRTTGPTTESGHSASFDLASMAAFRNLTSLPIVPKGVKTWQDAKKCLELGFPAVYISNHGGRIVDTAPTAVEILLDIRKNAPEVFEGMEVYADGGVRHGTDVIKLLALGARAVGLGRSPVFANVYGDAGVDRMIDLLSTELATTMALIGANTPDELNDDYINTKLVEQMYIK